MGKRRKCEPIRGGIQTGSRTLIAEEPMPDNEEMHATVHAKFGVEDEEILVAVIATSKDGLASRGGTAWRPHDEYDRETTMDVVKPRHVLSAAGNDDTFCPPPVLPQHTCKQEGLQTRNRFFQATHHGAAERLPAGVLGAVPPKQPDSVGREVSSSVYLDRRCDVCRRLKL